MLDATLERMTQAAKIRVRDSQVYVGLAETGGSLFEDKSSAARAHREDWRALLEWLELRAAELPSGNVTPLRPVTQPLSA